MHHSFETVTEYSAISHEIVENTPFRITILFKYRLSEVSTLEQKVIFYNDTAKVDFVTNVDWHESKKLLRVYFPLDIRSDYASYDIQNGFIRRSSHTNNSYDAAKHEVYGHKFCDVSDSKFGVSILNDCKYGFSTRNGTIGMSLLKAPKFPNHEADMGDHHSFIYSIFPHEKPLVDSNIFEEAHKLNNYIWAAVFNKP